MRPGHPLTWLRGRPQWGTIRLAFPLAAAPSAYLGFARYDAGNLDEAIGWYAGALACTLVFAWEGTLPATPAWLTQLRVFVRDHWLEGVALSGLMGFAVFMRLFRFGDYPPSELICCADDQLGLAAFDILHGDRPLSFPLVHYSSALGVLIFGENTTALRIPPLVLGVIALVPFYLLLRQMVSAPAALFATSLLASSRLFLDVTTRHQPAMLEAVLLALFLVRGMRTGSSLMFAGFGLMSG